MNRRCRLARLNRDERLEREQRRPTEVERRDEFVCREASAHSSLDARRKQRTRRRPRVKNDAVNMLEHEPVPLLLVHFGVGREADCAPVVGRPDERGERVAPEPAVDARLALRRSPRLRLGRMRRRWRRGE